MESLVGEALTWHPALFSLGEYAPAFACIQAGPPFHGGVVVAFARIHARWQAGVSARIAGTSADYRDARRDDEAVVTRGVAGY